MELHQLRYLVAVAEAGTFTEAASRQFVSQSGVSAQIAKLERELGHRLFRRSGRTVGLTDAGEALLPHARAVLSAVDAMRETADELSGLLRGHVRLGMITGCEMPDFFGGLADFQARHPGVTVDVTEDDSERLIRGVSSGRIDVALAAYADAPGAGLRVTTVIEEDLVAVLPEGHRLSRSSRVRLSDLRDERPFCLSAGTGVRAAFDASLRRAGVDVAVGFSAGSPRTVIQMVRRGLGVAVLSLSMVDDPDLTVRPIVDAPVRNRLGLVMRSEPGAASAEELHAVLRAGLAPGS